MKVESITAILSGAIFFPLNVLHGSGSIKSLGLLEVLTHKAVGVGFDKRMTRKTKR